MKVNTSNEFYVYIFYCEEWGDIFYVGKGNGDRYKSLSDRNKQVKAIWNNHKCNSKIIFHGLAEEDALMIEKQLKITLKENGSPIIDGEIDGCNDRQREGIERARREGKYKGRKRIEIDDQIFEYQYTRYIKREITKTCFARNLNVSRPTLDKILRERGKIA